MTAEQLDLLAPSHSLDGRESRQAAANVSAEDQYHRVLRCLYDATVALTDDEIAVRCGLIRTSAGTRRGVAVKRGLVERYGTGVSAMGNPCAAWRLTAEGVTFAADLARRAA